VLSPGDQQYIELKVSAGNDTKLTRLIVELIQKHVEVVAAGNVQQALGRDR
jgi:hypothetical protein